MYCEASFYSFLNLGNDSFSIGFGNNVRNNYGISAYFTSNIGIGANVQISPQVTYGAEISVLGGISVSFGTISDNITNETTISVGWGTLAGAYVLLVAPVPGTRALLAGAIALIVSADIFN